MAKPYRHVIRAIYNTEWAILPEKLNEIVSLVELRASGIELSQDEIRERLAIGGRGRSGEPLAPMVKPGVALLNLHGTISYRMNFFSDFSGGTSIELFTKAFREAMANPDVHTILIDADTPGGTVPGVPEAAQMIFEARQKKRIITLINPMMASAGLWIGTAASEVIAVPSADAIGSIGVLFMHTDQVKADEEAGLRRTIIRSSEFKAEGNPYEELTQSAIDYIKSRVMAIDAEFVSAMARNRNVPISKVESEFGRGRVMRAKEALSVGLIDRIATMEQVLEELGGGAGSSTGFAAQSPQGSTKGPKRMNAKIRKALVIAGLCKASDDQAAFEAALSLHCEAEGIDVKNEQAVLASLAPQQLEAVLTNPEPTTAAPPAQKPSGNAAMSIHDLTAAIQLSGVPAERQMTLVGELSKSLETMSVSQVLNRINEESVKGSKAAGAGPVRVTEDSTDKFYAAARDALLVRTWGVTKEGMPTEIFDYRSGEMVAWKAPRQNYGLQNMLKLAEQVLVHSGVPYAKVASLAPMQIAKLMMGADPSQMGLGFLASSDGPAYNVSGMFSNLLLDAANVTLRRSYDDAKTTFQLWCKQAPAIADFKAVNRVIAGELGDPRAVPEDGTFEETTLTDGKETYKLTVWGEIFSMSWQLIVNDQLGSFTEIPAKMGRAMRRKQNRIVYSAVRSNRSLADGIALFDASTHKNRTTGTLTTSADYAGAFGVMERKMAEQIGLSTDSGALNLTPRFCIFPPAISKVIRETLNSQSVASTANSGTANIYQGAYEPIQEAELGAAFGGSDTRFILAADNMDVDTIEYAFLQGLEAPVIEQEVSFTSLGMKRRIYQAFAMKEMDYRGLQDHTGA